MFKKIFLIITCLLLFSFSFSEETQTITITKEDIINAKASPYPVNFDKKDLKAITMMEKRHFPRSYPELSDSERIRNLEWELFGKIWVYSPTKDRIEKLKLASMNTCLIGTALPRQMSSNRTVKRLSNNELGLRKRDNVGLIDGFLRLLSPEKYEVYRQHADKRFYSYEY